MLRYPALAGLALALAACEPAPLPPEPAVAATPATAATPAAEPAAGLPAPAPLASPVYEVKASMDRFLEAKSFHAVMTMQGARGLTNDMDFVAPDRYRMRMATGTQLIIGDTMYMQADGRSMKVPLPTGSLSKWRDPLKLAENRAGLTVEALGNDPVDGLPAKKYRVGNTRPDADEFALWIGANGLPLQLVQTGHAQGQPYTMTLRYSRFDDPSITIDAPQ